MGPLGMTWAQSGGEDLGEGHITQGRKGASNEVGGRHMGTSGCGGLPDSAEPIF